MDKIIPSNNESSDLENSTNRTNPVTDGDGSKIPDRIYLDFLENCNDYDAIWCDEPMNDTDIEYVRAPHDADVLCDKCSAPIGVWCYDCVDEAIESLAPRWIPVSERLPESGGYYLTSCPFAGDDLIAEAHYDGDGIWVFPFYSTGKDVISVHPQPEHWMPLPEPPEEE